MANPLIEDEIPDEQDMALANVDIDGEFEMDGVENDGLVYPVFIYGRGLQRRFAQVDDVAIPLLLRLSVEIALKVHFSHLYTLKTSTAHDDQWDQFALQLSAIHGREYSICTLKVPCHRSLVDDCKKYSNVICRLMYSLTERSVLHVGRPHSAREHARCCGC
jgi:hypothetical protein